MRTEKGPELHKHMSDESPAQKERESILANFYASKPTPDRESVRIHVLHGYTPPPRLLTEDELRECDAREKAANGLTVDDVRKVRDALKRGRIVDPEATAEHFSVVQAERGEV